MDTTPSFPYLLSDLDSDRSEDRRGHKILSHQERLHDALIFVELCHILWLFTE